MVRWRFFGVTPSFSTVRQHQRAGGPERTEVRGRGVAADVIVGARAGAGEHSDRWVAHTRFSCAVHTLGVNGVHLLVVKPMQRIAGTLCSPYKEMSWRQFWLVNVRTYTRVRLLFSIVTRTRPGPTKSTFKPHLFSDKRDPASLARCIQIMLRFIKLHEHRKEHRKGRTNGRNGARFREINHLQQRYTRRAGILYFFQPLILALCPQRPYLRPAYRGTPL